MSVMSSTIVLLQNFMKLKTSSGVFSGHMTKYASYISRESLGEKNWSTQPYLHFFSFIVEIL